jgi:transposase-like protein
VVTGVREDGYREILGAKIADSEDEGFWSGLFDELKERGLEGVKMQELAAELNQKRHSKSANTMDRFSQDLWNYKAFPREHWRKIRTTNGLERINKEDFEKLINRNVYILLILYYFVYENTHRFCH